MLTVSPGGKDDPVLLGRLESGRAGLEHIGALPGERRRRTPLSRLVVPSRTIPVSGLVSFTVAFGTLAPDGSVTVPDSEAVVLFDCAEDLGGEVSAMVVTKTAKTMKRSLIILPPKIFNCRFSIALTTARDSSVTVPRMLV